MPTRSPARRRGFTLTELLIVIGIIIILVAIFIPAVGRARVTAQRSSTSSFMNSVLTASAQFQAAERRAPGYFSQLQMGSSTNYTSGSDSGQGFTQMENALIDLAGGIDPDQENRPGPPDPDDETTGRIEVGPYRDGSPQNVVIRRSLIGAPGKGPGYLTLAEEFVDMGSYKRAQAGDLRHNLMPDLIDAFGTPILMWTKNDLAGSGDLVYDNTPSGQQVAFALTGENNDVSSPGSTQRAWFYLASNSGHIHSRTVGKAVKNQRDLSLLSNEWSAGSRDPLLVVDSISGLLGHPSFPQYDVPNRGAREPFPEVPRGDIIIHSAGQDGIYASSGKQSAGVPQSPFGAIQYLPSGYQLQAADDEWFDRAGDTVDTTVDRLDDILASHGGG